MNSLHGHSVKNSRHFAVEGAGILRWVKMICAQRWGFDNPVMTLNYLDFDYSEDTGGVGSFEAMASVRPEQVAPLHAEIARVLDWSFAQFPARGDIGEGGDWDYVLQGQQEVLTPVRIEYDETGRCFSVQLEAAQPPRQTVSFSISGTAAFCQALRQQFGID